MKRHLSLGWKPDLPDFRDLAFRAPRIARLPPIVDLRLQCPPVYDQGELGSCTANAIAAAVDFDRLKQKSTPIAPSRLFIYYGERLLEGTVAQDAGAFIRDGIKVVAKKGVCPEKEWPYNPGKFATKPPAACFSDALRYQATQYMRVSRNLADIQACLAAGFPIVFGFTVYDGFMSQHTADSGVLSMPTKDESVQGGHAVLLVGYNTRTKCFIVRNSWGPRWGQSGYFTMPFAYLTNPGLSDDFWTIRLVE